MENALPVAPVQRLVRRHSIDRWFYAVVWEDSTVIGVAGSLYLQDYATSPRKAWKAWLDFAGGTRQEWQRKGKRLSRFKLSFEM